MSGGEDIVAPLFEVLFKMKVKNSLGFYVEDIFDSKGKIFFFEAFTYSELEVESGWDDTAFVDSSEEFDNDFIGSVVINDFEFTNVS